MLFFPYKVDINLKRLPLLTILVCIACMAIYYFQYKNNVIVERAAIKFCEANKEKLFSVVVEKITSARTVRNCAKVIYSIHVSDDPELRIQSLAEDYHVFDTLNFAQGRTMVSNILNEEYDKFRKTAPASLTSQLYYVPGSFDVGHMISAVFAHGNVSHLLGNLFFFFAFAASVEIIAGMFAFSAIILTLAIGTNLSYSAVMLANPDALPTLGLSGVVMGMIALFVFLLPTAKIRCFFWFLVIVRILHIPAWFLAAWYIGWDVFQLYSAHMDSSHNGSNINLVAHVSGAVIGFLIGIVFYRNKRPVITASKRLRKPT
jgi:membrane associated rhomboid family serine protease